MTPEELASVLPETSEPSAMAPEAPATVEECPPVEIPDEEVPVEEAPAEEAPAEEVPVEEAPVEEAPVEEAPVEEAPVEEPPVEEAPVVEAPAEEPAPAKAKKQAQKRKKPHILLRIPLQLLSFLTTFALFAIVVVGVLLLDLRQLTSAGGIKQLINTVIGTFTSAPVQTVPTPQRPILQVLTTGGEEGDYDIDLDGDIVIGEDGSIVVGGSDIDLGDIDLGEIPGDILTGGDVSGVVDWIYEKIDESVEGELPFTQDEIVSFVEESTVSDYLSEKIADYADDFLNGTQNAEITVEELMNLVEENEELLKEKLNVELTQEVKDQIHTTVEKIVVEQDINATIRDTVYTAVDEVLKDTTDSMGGITVDQLQGYLQLLNSDQLLYTVIGAAVVILLLLCLLNFYNVPAGLTWASLPCINAGLLLSAPILLLQNSSDLIVGIVPEAAVFVEMAASYVTVFAPYHYGVLAIGVGLLVVSILWRIIRAIVRKHR